MFPVKPAIGFKGVNVVSLEKMPNKLAPTQSLTTVCSIRTVSTTVTTSNPLLP